MYRALRYAPSIKDMVTNKDRYNLCYLISKFCFVNSLKVNEAVKTSQNLFLIYPEAQWEIFTTCNDLC